MMLNIFPVDSAGQCYLKGKGCIVAVPLSFPTSTGREQTSETVGISSSTIFFFLIKKTNKKTHTNK